MLRGMAAAFDNDDDLLDELPAPDGGDDDDQGGVPSDQEDFEVVEEGTIDDGDAASELFVGDLIDPIDDASSADRDEGGSLDVGEGEGLQEQEPGSDDDDDVGAVKEDLSVGLDEIPSLGVDDPGAGPASGYDDEVDEAELPAMDADEDGDGPVGDDAELTDV